jgi:hypothetical protein
MTRVRYSVICRMTGVRYSVICRMTGVRYSVICRMTGVIYNVICRMTGVLLIGKNSEGIGCGLIWFYHGICLEGLQKSTHYLSQDSWLPSRDSTWIYNVTATLTCSVFRIIRKVLIGPYIYLQTYVSNNGLGLRIVAANILKK